MTTKSLCARAQEKSRSRRWATQVASFAALRIAAYVNCAALVTACVFLLINGVGALSWDFVFDSPRKMMTEGGVFPCLVGTFLLAAGAIAIALPFGVACAVWLNEYGKQGTITNIVRLSVANLAGVPSIVFGLFGLAFFVTALGFNVSLLSGILTLAVLTLPVIINTTEEALKQVPGAWRDASLALGATKSQTIGRIVLPAALPGILTGAILAVARAAGETSAVMFTAAVFYTPKLPESCRHFDSRQDAEEANELISKFEGAPREALLAILNLFEHGCFGRGRILPPRHFFALDVHRRDRTCISSRAARQEWKFFR